ncbi:MAG: FAD-dependent oxidoreductase [Chloroflexi bacterium]|nr:FAD-dependent oxidoreductase [Chloroflexota bacterium]
MATSGAEVVIVGGGIVGLATAYFLAKEGVRSVVIERDAVGSHASGFAFGNLSPMGGVGIPGPLYPLAQEGMRLHRELAAALPAETGIDTAYRPRPALDLVFTEEEQRFEQGRLGWRQQQPGYQVRWLEPAEARAVEPRVSEQILGAVSIEGTAEVDPYRFVLALAQGAEKLGATIRHGTVRGLLQEGGRIRGVRLEHEEMACGRVVIAMGPWSGEASAWLGLPVEVRPLKGQILRLRAPGPPVQCSVGWSHHYASTKPDGLLWAGTTEEEAGFDENPTQEGRETVMGALLKMMPALAEAQLVRQTACLRPLSRDWLPVLGAVPDRHGVYVATGAGRKGILVGPAMGRATADLILRGGTELAIEPLGVGRFAKMAAP